MGLSLLQQMRLLPEAEQEKALFAMAAKQGITLEELAQRLVKDWSFQGRPEQLQPDGDWKLWVVMTGRRWGKTRTAAEWIHKRVASLPRSSASTGGLLQRTSADLRDIMIEGPSGLLATAKEGFAPKYAPSKKRVTYPSGYTFQCYTAEEPDALRGPTLSTLWADEFASLKTVTGIDGLTAFDNAIIALSAPVHGDRPRGIVTTTPRRVKSVKSILSEAKLHPEDYRVTNGKLSDNIDNLDAITVRDLMTKYAGTALGQQELEGVLASDVEGAPFKSHIFDRTRIVSLDECPPLATAIIAVDPSAGDGTSDECGISVCALSAMPIMTEFQQGGLVVVRKVPHLYVLEDASMSGAPDVWARHVAEKAAEYGTNIVIAEGNQGGEMVKTVIRGADPNLKVRVIHARVGKHARAEPIASLFAQNRAHLVGEQSEMEDQATTHTRLSKDSPDRMDAMVWGGTFLVPKALRTTTVQSSESTKAARAAMIAKVTSMGGATTSRRRAGIGSPDSGTYLGRRIG